MDVQIREHILSLSLSLLHWERIRCKQKNRIIFFIPMMFCPWLLEKHLRKQIFFIQHIGRKSHQSCYYVSHNGLNHEPKFCWFITVYLLLCDASLFFASVWNGFILIASSIFVFVFVLFIMLLFGGYNSALIIQHLHNYNTIISWWKLFHSIYNIFTE